MLNRRFYIVLILILLYILQGCRKNTLFEKQGPGDTGIVFTNQILEDERNNIMTYQYTYNGGGIAVGDLNKDGISDVYLVGNTVSNKLFLNDGNWKFEDVSKKAGLEGRDGWKTGVSMVDVNSDGWLDIYVCYSGNAPSEGYNKPIIKNYKPRANQLFINNGCEPGGIPTFTESAEKYGLDASGSFSSQAYFFDYDLDGDLDMFLLNHANMFYSPFFNVQKLRNLRHPYFGNKMYRNDDGKFSEVTDLAGIHGSGLNFGLSAAISDLNQDGWPDIYVTNDYEEQDFCYLNNQDGSFSEVSHSAFGHLSKFGMGSDIADINNDALPDIFVADMFPEDNYRRKVLEGVDEYDKFTLAVDSGYHYQYMRNTLQLHQGLAQDSLPKFSEIAQFSGVASTDWSWAPLIADYDNDGFKDIFITNGFLRDLTNLDFVKFQANQAMLSHNANKETPDLLSLVHEMPSTKIANYSFKNVRGNKFKDFSKEWGLQEKTVSTGAVYADLDNDGDLDLIVSNLNEPVYVYKNNQERIHKNNFIKIQLKGQGKNTQSLGAKLYLTLDNDQQIFQEAYYARGYLSSVEPVFSLGLGSFSSVKEVKVIWPDQRISEFKNIPGNQTLVIDQAHAERIFEDEKLIERPILKEITLETELDFIHQENSYVDFTQQRLLPYQISRLGRPMDVGDVNGDGNDDVFFGSAAGQAGQLYLGTNGGNLIKKEKGQGWQTEEDVKREDVNALFFDADMDGDLDLYVVSGGNEYPENSDYYQDRIYLNDGSGNFEKSDNALPPMLFSGGAVVAGDYDQDGDLDLFIGGRIKAKNYPSTPQSFLLRNDSNRGDIKFSVVEKKEVGMVTDALWVDINQDSWLDLIIVGEWMPVTIFQNNKGILNNITKDLDLKSTSGWWTSISSGDFDKDGDVDFILGNAGINSRFVASENKPMRFYVQDLNGDGVMDPILSTYIQGGSYPFPTRDELLGQVTSLRKEYTTYDKYGRAKMKDILEIAATPPVEILEIQNLRSSYMENLGDGFKIKYLPEKVQISTVQGFIMDDFTGDGLDNILMAGNFFPNAVNIGKSDASFGFLLDYKNGNFSINSIGNNLGLSGDIRKIDIMKFNNGSKRLVVMRNNDKASVYEISSLLNNK